MGLLISFLVGSFVWALFFAEKNPMESLLKETKEREKTSDSQFHDVTFSEVVEGVKYWELVAKTATVNQFYGRTKLNKVNGRFFDNDEPALKFDAPYAIWNMKQKAVQMEKVKGVSLSLEKEAILKSKEVIWKLEDKKIQPQKGVTIESGNITFHGETLTGDVGLRKIVLTGKPKAILTQ